MKLYERFGLNSANVDPEILIDVIKGDEEAIEEGHEDWERNLNSLATNRAVIAVCYYLMEDFKRSRKYANESIAAAMEFFFGNWRQKQPTENDEIDPEWWHENETWTDLFRLSLFWASVIDDWKSLRRLASYPDDKSGTDVETTPAQRQLYLEISEFIRSDGKLKIKSKVSKLKGADRHGAAAAAVCLENLSAKDLSSTQNAMDSIFQKHAKARNSDDLTDTICVDGTLMLNLARHFNVDVKLDPKFEHYFVAMEKP